MTVFVIGAVPADGDAAISFVKATATTMSELATAVTLSRLKRFELTCFEAEVDVPLTDPAANERHEWRLKLPTTSSPRDVVQLCEYKTA